MKPLVTWYGDDFTGAAAVMEVLAFAGIETVLFTEVPDKGLLSRFKTVNAIGVASTARTEGPEWMHEHLPSAFRFLTSLGAPILHYKVCSTFDSSPTKGNIGCAAEIGLNVTNAHAAAMITAAPKMRRYQAFGNLFAGTFDGVFRLDRHPVMSQHPVTPMGEADLLEHLREQTGLKSGLIDLEDLWSDPSPKLKTLIDDGVRILSIDSMEDRSEAAAGKLIWENRDTMPFVLGSQGVEFALVRHWQNTGMIPPPPRVKSVGKVDQIAVISGSVSPSTADQIAWAEGNGFAVIRFDAASVISGAQTEAQAISEAVDKALSAFSKGASPLICSATGPSDPAVAAVRSSAATTDRTIEEINKWIGLTLGRILDQILRTSGLKRAVISGGDTSGHGMGVLGLKALKAIAPTVPGASLCIGYGGEHHDGLEIALKGGQMGTIDFFGWVKDGGGPR